MKMVEPETVVKLDTAAEQLALVDDYFDQLVQKSEQRISNAT